MIVMSELIDENFAHNLGIKTILVKDLKKFKETMDDSVLVIDKDGCLVLESDGGSIEIMEG